MFKNYPHNIFLHGGGEHYPSFVEGFNYVKKILDLSKENLSWLELFKIVCYFVGSSRLTIITTSTSLLQPKTCTVLAEAARSLL
jgi:hypothetical protein